MSCFSVLSPTWGGADSVHRPVITGASEQLADDLAAAAVALSSPGVL